MEDKMKELIELMGKIDEAMEMTKNNQKDIDNIRSSLMPETRPMVIEKKKAEIEEKENAKKEFDEMTVPAILRAKGDILIIREQSEKEYQDKLIETVEKRKRIESKLKSMEGKGLDDEKLSMARKSAEKALTTVNEEMKEYQEKHFSKREKLAEFEKKVEDYAIELGIEEELKKVSLEKDGEGKTDSTPVPTPKATTEPTPVPTPKATTEPIPAPTQKTATEPTSVPTPKVTAKPTPVPTPKPKTKPKTKTTYEIEDIAEEIFENQYAYRDGYDEEGKVKADKRIQSIRFVFESGKPQYIITTKSGHILTANVNAENQKLYEPATKEIKKKIDEELGFKRAHKFADPFLLKFLKDYDGANKTSEYERYVKILEDGSKRKFMNDDNEPEIMIDYDLNDKELAGMDKESIRNIQRLARKNDWYEIAIYTKAKGTIARLIDKYIKTPRLKAAKEATKEEDRAKRKELEEKKLGHDNEFKRGLRNRSTTKLFGGKEGKFSNPRQAKSKNKKGEAFEFTIEEIKEDEEVR